MKQIIFYLFIVVNFFTANLSYSQRTHEFRINLSLYRNSGVSFYDFHEEENIRHNFEWDQIFKAQLIELGWRYPVSPYLHIGFHFSKSIHAEMELLQAESAVYNSNQGSAPQLATLFSGLTTFESNFREIGMDFKLNHLLRSKKFKIYITLGPGLQAIKNAGNNQIEFETESEDLKNDLLQTYSGKEVLFTLSYGLGLTYPIGKGLNLNIIEVMGKYTPDHQSSDFFVFSNSLVIKSGISYKLLRNQ